MECRSNAKKSHLTTISMTHRFLLKILCDFVLTEPSTNVEILKMPAADGLGRLMAAPSWGMSAGRGGGSDGIQIPGSNSGLRLGSGPSPTAVGGLLVQPA